MYNPTYVNDTVYTSTKCQRRCIRLTNCIVSVIPHYSKHKQIIHIENIELSCVFCVLAVITVSKGVQTEIW